MENIYLCDIDGTLASHEGIRGPFDEDKVYLDIPLPTCRVIECLMNNTKIIFLSGRTEGCRKNTQEWLTKHLGMLEPLELYMRKIGDIRPDDIVKEELYNTHIKDKYNVFGVFDDRLKVCRMWYKLGLFVFNCNQGLKEF